MPILPQVMGAGGAPQPSPTPAGNDPKMDKLRSQLADFFTGALGQPEPKAPMYQPQALTPLQGYAQARNPQLAGQLEQSYQAPSQAMYAQQQAEFEKAMDTRKMALGGAVSMVNADAANDARLGKTRTRDINTVIPPGQKGAGQPIIVTEVTDAAGNVLSRRFTGYGRNPIGITDTNYGILMYHQLGDPFAPFGGGEPGQSGGAKDQTGGGPPPPPPAAPTGEHVKRSMLEKRYGNDPAGMARAIAAAKQRGLPIVEDTVPQMLAKPGTEGQIPPAVPASGQAATTPGRPSVGAGGFIEVGGQRALKTPSDIMLQSLTNQENLRGSWDTAKGMMQEQLKVPGGRRFAEDIAFNLPLVGPTVTKAAGYADAPAVNTTRALGRVSQILNYLVSGKQISEQEFRRLRPNLPELGDAPDVAKDKILRFDQEIARIEGVRGAVLPGLSEAIRIYNSLKSQGQEVKGYVND